MSRHIIFQALLGGFIGALAASGFYSVTYTTMRQGGSGLLPGALVIASAAFVLFFLLFLLEFTFWSALRKMQRKTRPSS
jgi:hypothetical protein